MRSYHQPTVIITRTREMAEPLGRLVEDLGFYPFYYPTIQITPCQHEDVFYENRGQSFDMTLVTSQNAVTHGQYFIEQADKLGQVFAVGKASQSALEDHNLFGIRRPADKFCSESLLQLPELAADKVRGKSILILCGQAPRNLLGDTLEERGAKVTRACVYKRRLPHAKFAKHLNKYHPDAVDALVFYSVSSIYNFMQLAQQANFDYSGVPCIAVSQRIAKAAQDVGFTSVNEASNVSNEAVASAIAGAVQPD